MVKVNSTVITLGVAAVLAVAIGYWVNSSLLKPAEQDTAKLATGEAEKPAQAASTKTAGAWAASATGRVEPQNGEVRIAAEVSGKIMDIGVDVNDRVKAGDLLIRLDDRLARTKLESATAQEDMRLGERDDKSVSGLSKERRNAADAVADAERAVFGARQVFDDAMTEFRAGDGSQQVVDDARTKLSEAETKLTDERANLATVEAKSGMPDPSQLESALAIARADLAAAELAVERTRVRALTDGTVLNVMAKEGELAIPSPENTLLIFGDLGALSVRSEVEERDAAKIRVGQRVVVRADAYPDQEFTGRVSSIAQSLSTPRIATRGPRRPNDVEVLEAVVDLDGSPPLLTGMRVDVFFRHNATASTEPTTN